MEAHLIPNQEVIISLQAAGRVSSRSFEENCVLNIQEEGADAEVENTLNPRSQVEKSQQTKDFLVAGRVAIRIRNLIEQDEFAIRDWAHNIRTALHPTRLVKHKLQIEHMLEHQKYGEAILRTLDVWRANAEDKDVTFDKLCDVLKERGLAKVADTLKQKKEEIYHPSVDNSDEKPIFKKFRYGAIATMVLDGANIIWNWWIFFATLPYIISNIDSCKMLCADFQFVLLLVFVIFAVIMTILTIVDFTLSAVFLYKIRIELIWPQTSCFTVSNVIIFCTIIQLGINIGLLRLIGSQLLIVILIGFVLLCFRVYFVRSSFLYQNGVEIFTDPELD